MALEASLEVEVFHLEKYPSFINTCVDTYHRKQTTRNFIMLLMLLFINTNFITLIATTNSREREQVQEYHTTIMEDNNLLEADEIAYYKKRDSFIHSFMHVRFIHSS